MAREQIVAFFAFSVIAAITPGPSNLMVMVAGARGGFRGGLACLGGVVAGMSLMMAAAGLGVGAFVAAWPPALVALRWAGAAFLLWLAWKVGTAAPSPQAAGASAPAVAAAPDPPRAARVSLPGAASPIGFGRALAFQWINPKSWIVSVSAASTYAAHDDGALLRAAMLAFIFALAAAPGCAVWLAFGASMKRWLADARRARAFNVAMGAGLAASVLLVVR